VDGSKPPGRPAALRDLAGDVVVSRVNVRRIGSLEPADRACAESFRGEFDVPAGGVAVERTSTLGQTLTFRDRSRRLVLGCDRTRREIVSGTRRWCARSVGRLFGGRLRDARVDVLCRDAGGRRLGFGWIEPGPSTRWVVLRTDGSASIERIAAGLPLRVATTSVEVDTSTATFRTEEYDAAGRVVRRSTLAARVAG
jgi:hypothetical protein